MDLPCDNSSNPQPDQEYDAASGILYEAWIGCGGIGFTRSLDGGYSFLPAYRVPGSVPPIANTTELGSAWDPDLAIAPNGTVYVAYMAGYIDGYLPGAQPVVAWSWNHGVSFQGYANVSHWYNGTYSDRDSIAVAPNGTLFVTWDYSPNNTFLPAQNDTVDRMNCNTDRGCSFDRGDFNIVVAWSADGGQTWSSPQPVSPGYPNGAATTAELAVDASGTLDVLFQAYTTTGPPTFDLGVASEYFTHSSDGGIHWSMPVVLSNQTFSNAPWWVDGDLDIGPNGTLYAAFSTTAAGNLSTPWVTSSSDGGTTWTAPLQIAPTVYQTYYMAMSVAGEPNGAAYVDWISNNSTGESYSAWGTLTQGYGSSSGPVQSLYNQTGAPAYWPGDTVGATWLGGTAVALTFSLGLYSAVNDNVRAQVIFTTEGLATPGTEPLITLVVPGIAAANISYSATPGNSTITGYLLAWTIEGNFEGSTILLPTARAGTAINLVPGAHYQFTVAAINGAGAGPASPPANLTLSAWSIYRGTVDPSDGLVYFDALLVPSTGGAYLVNSTFNAHAMSAVASSYAREVVVVTSTWNGTTWFNFSLTLLPSAVRGTVFPAASSVEWDGAALGVGPTGDYAVASPPDSNHTLVVAFTGFVTQVRTLDVPANATVWVNVTLLPEVAELVVTLHPAIANLWVNHSQVAVNGTGTAQLALPAGTYPIEAAAPGYQTYFENVSLIPGVTANLSIALVHSNPTPGRNGTGGSGGFAFLTNGGLPYLAAFLVVIIGAVVILAVLRRRRERRYRPPPKVIDPGEVERERQLAARTPVEESIR